jgi:4-hydroxybenzoate polyprenyltransferase
LHTIAGLLVLYIGYAGQFTVCYWIGCCIFIGLLIYQHMVVKATDLSRVNIAYMTMNGVASMVFAVFTIISFFF